MNIKEGLRDELQVILEQNHMDSEFFIAQRGNSLTLCRGTPDDPNPRARFTWLQTNTWGLSLPRHTGRWERTPFVGPLPDVFGVLVEQFGFYLMG